MIYFCDSENSMQLELPKFGQAARLYPRLLWVLLFQTAKDGKFLGEKNWQHVVDVEVYCEDGKVRTLKNRIIAQALDITQQHLSRLEQRDEIGDELLEKIAKALNVSVEAIKNMNDEAAINYINTFYDSSVNGSHYHCTFNPIEKIIELYNEKMELYERILKETEEKVAMLQKMFAELKVK